ncbi:hypothetical protein DID88_002437 [Monilinia fructigena]|uniref:Epidermal growth factor receptor-like transmembrane-juxtamembrane segment domain-containing protein n=1 Tax=Monilinia fructigena TaxID=38457 RepID=A0A395IQR7_9HELO|nr:hypothetical protein DID88_002437 [Monilinia fructigena]
MSTSANLPAGFSITSINGVRCTAVPRSAAEVSSVVTTAVPVSSVPTSTSYSSSSTSTLTPTTSTSSSTPEDTTQTPQPVSTSISIVTAATSTPVTFAAEVPAVQFSSTTTTTTAAAAVESTTSTPLPSPPPALAAATSSVSETPTTLTDITTTTSAIPASKGTNPTELSSASLAIAQSELSTIASTTHSPTIHATSVKSATASSTKSVESPSGGGISSLGHLMTAPVIAGILGGIGFLAIIALLIFFCNRRRKLKRNSLLTPLNPGTRDQFYDIDKKTQGQYYDIYDDSVGSAGRGTNFRAQIGGAATTFGAGVAGIGSTLKSHVHPGNKPTINLNRGNSQFYEAPIPYHSRNNSVMSIHSLHYAARDRADDLTSRVKGVFRRTQKETDPFAMAIGMPKKQANINTRQEFGNLMDMDDRNLLLKTERRHLSLSFPTRVPDRSLAI